MRQDYYQLLCWGGTAMMEHFANIYIACKGINFWDIFFVVGSLQFLRCR